MNNVLRPAADWELASFLSDASANNLSVEVIGGESKAAFGRPRAADAYVSTHVLRGIPYYDPSARLISVQSGCLIADIERELAANGQMLPFEPVDIGPVLGGEAGRSTIGGVIAANLPGSRRISAGSIRDHLAGGRAVSGSGRIFQSGGRVMRATTGLDLTRVLTGSWGTFATLFEVTLRVAPLPEATATAVVLKLSEEIAVEAMRAALAAPLHVTGTVHLEPPLAARLWDQDLRDQGEAVTAFRLECPAAFMPQRLERLQRVLRPYGAMHRLGDDQSLGFWGEMRSLSVFQDSSRPLWRISTRPSQTFELITGIRRYMPVDAALDWSGGLIWLQVPDSADAGATDIRRVLAAYGGHATLVRASPEVRTAVEVFQPMEPGTEIMTRRLKQVFDPAGILNPGRMYAGI